MQCQTTDITLKWRLTLAAARLTRRSARMIADVGAVGFALNDILVAARRWRAEISSSEASMSAPFVHCIIIKIVITARRWRAGISNSHDVDGAYTDGCEAGARAVPRLAML